MGAKVTLTSDDFQAAIEGDDIILVDFHATWCPPCKAMAPIIEELADDYDGRAKVGALDVDASADIASRYGVTAVPTFIIFKDGKPQKTFVGHVPKENLASGLDEVLAG